MPKILPVHYQPTSRFRTSCDLDILASGQVTIGTDDPAGVTCSRCIMSPAMALTSRTAWVEAQRAEDERRFRTLLALDTLYRETPWWALAERHLIRKTLAAATA